MTAFYHIPVLPEESIRGLNLFPGANVADATYGGGGHSRLILKELGDGRLFAFDQDEDAAEQVIRDERLIFIHHNFRYIRNFLRFFHVNRLDAVFADLGVSSHDFDVAERGFSFRFDSKLDMRMNREGKTDAAFVVNNYSEDRLILIFALYGEIKNARHLVSEIIRERSRNPIRTTTRLKEIASRCAPKAVGNKYLARVFQALRIEVNLSLIHI